MPGEHGQRTVNARLQAVFSDLQMAAMIAQHGSSLRDACAGDQVADETAGDTIEEITAVIGRAAGIIGGLAAELALIETALEEQAYAASRYGVNIGTDGRPPPVSAGDAADATTASTQHWALAYRHLYDQAMAEAQQARQQATRQLMDLCTKVESPRQALATSDSHERQPGRRPGRGR
jgi:hypothetical protein